ncbi:MAG TPA: succinate dehydrogenase iron-sulfur subunit, partial [Acidobacteriota bacterium]|nr:succinate dehydrogenase iron-sulfur subunit [Acidobacteriota bacterium]
SKPSFERYEAEARPDERLLDVLVDIQRRLDPTLVFRKSCGHGVCGSDAMVINGRERLACKTLVKDVAVEGGPAVTVEPLRNLEVLRDLAVDQEPFFRRYRSVKPYLIAPDAGAEGRERLQSPEERSAYDDATNCILCAACFSACPVLSEVNARFLGPAAIVQASRFLEDSRDRGLEDRLPALDHPDGVWPCEDRFECTRVCPRGIKVTKLINRTKRTITRFKDAKPERR